jgi:hypothetical protein
MYGSIFNAYDVKYDFNFRSLNDHYQKLHDISNASAKQ